MRVEKFQADKSGKLSKIINDHYQNISYNVVQKMLRKKDIKINNKRISFDCDVFVGDEIVFFVNESDVAKLFEHIYEDENILIVFKKRGIEVVSQNGNDLASLIEKEKSLKVYPVHRLDRNTEGLVIFAKNLEAKNELDYGFKNRTFEKFYITQVYGEMEKVADNLIAFLKKDPGKAFVEISDAKKVGFEKIQTNYKVLKQLEDSSILEVELITGKTHQIRAHLAHIGHFIIGDEKYGNDKINRKFNKKYQNLIAYKLILHFSKNTKLFYLDNKIFEINKNKVDFFEN